MPASSFSHHSSTRTFWGRTENHFRLFAGSTLLQCTARWLLLQQNKTQKLLPLLFNGWVIFWYFFLFPRFYLHKRKMRQRQNCFTLTQFQSVSTFESEVQNSLNALEPCSMDSVGRHQNCAKKLSPKIALHFKVLCESNATYIPFT